MKHIQRIFSVLLVAIICMSSISIFNMDVNAASNIVIGGVDIGYAVGDYFTKNGKTCLTSAFSNGTCHGHGICIANTDSRCNCLRYWPSKANCQIDLQATQCFGFARYCQWKVYGYHDGNASVKFTDISGKISAGNCTADTLKSKLLGCPAATHIRTGDDGHSMVVASTSNTTIQIVSCNKDGTCVIMSKNYTWDSFASYLKGRSGVAYAKAIKGSSPSSQISTNPDDYTYPSSTIYRTSPTMKGSTVSWVQAVLYQLGYSIDIDGSYGANSEAVVKKFQGDNGLEVDGRVGPATRTKLLELWNKKKHTHSFEVLTETAHPHKVYKSCSCGHKEYTGEYKTVYTCNSCLPEKSVLAVLAGTSLDYTSFSWKTAQGADCYELIVYKKGEDKPVQWLYNLTTNQYKLLLSAGDYTAYVASINNDLIDSSCWWVYSDKVEFSVLEREVFAPSASAEFNGNKYEIYDVNMSWIEAKAKCEELGGHLVTVNNEDEMNAVHQLMSQGQYAMHWLGITDEEQEGAWKDITGNVLVYSNWRAGSPDNDNNVEHYGLILNDGTWGDVSNMYPGEIGFICEYETEDNTNDKHVHDYYIAALTPSTCTERGYKIYACECGYSYTDYTDFEEHAILQIEFGTASSTVDFYYEFCQICRQVLEFRAVYPDGSDKKIDFPQNTVFPDCNKTLGAVLRNVLFDADLKANLSTADEEMIEFSWFAVGENKATIDEPTATFDELQATEDEVISTEDEVSSTEDEVSYYEFSIYSNNGELIETIKTTTHDYSYKAVITAFNADGDIIAISNVYSIGFGLYCADWWGYYGDVDLKGGINVKDATLIQKYLANIVTLEKHPLKQADVNSDGKVNIKDATVIQKYCAKIDVESRIGNEYWDGYTGVSSVIVELAR